MFACRIVSFKSLHKQKSVVVMFRLLLPCLVNHLVAPQVYLVAPRSSPHEVVESAVETRSIHELACLGGPSKSKMT